MERNSGRRNALGIFATAALTHIANNIMRKTTMGIFTFGLTAFLAAAFAVWLGTKGGRKWKGML